MLTKLRFAALLAMALSATLPKSHAAAVASRALPNGLLWLHKPVRHNKIVAFRLMFPGGAVDEPAARAGLTHLMTAVMFKGTAGRSALRIAQEAESAGASLGAGAEEDYWEVSGQSTVDAFPRAFDIFRDVLLNPSFPPEEVAKEREAQLNDIRAKKERIFDVAYERLQAELFGPHPYGRPVEGTAETVSALTRDDLARWHRARLNPRGAVLVTVGDVPTGKLRTIIERSFAGWTAAAAPAAPEAAPRYPVRPVAAEEKHPFEQSFAMVAWPAPPLADPDYAALKVLNALLGAGMSSPLFQAVREDAGLAYEVSSFFPSRRLGSGFVVYAGTDPKNLDLAEKKMRDTVEALAARLPDGDALRDAKRYIRGHFMMDHQTNGRMAWYLAWWEILGKGHDYDGRYLADVDAVDAASLRRAAEHLFHQPATCVRIRSAK